MHEKTFHNKMVIQLDMKNGMFFSFHCIKVRILYLAVIIKYVLYTKLNVMVSAVWSRFVY